jgi:hypothetical protein
MFKKLLLLIFIIALTNCKKNKTIRLYLNSTTDYLPEELFETYLEYTALEEYTNNTCNLENFIESNPKHVVLKKIEESKCIPDYKSFAAILDNGWTEIAEKMIKNIYLDKNIDPTHTLYTNINKNEAKIKYLQQLDTEQETYEKLRISYDFENFDNSIKFKVNIPDLTYVLEDYSIFCYKDMFKLHAVFRSRNKFYKIEESKQFYDLIDGDCEHNYDSFSGIMNISFNKVNKYKKWIELFK